MIRSKRNEVTRREKPSQEVKRKKREKGNAAVNKREIIEWFPRSIQVSTSRVWRSRSWKQPHSPPNFRSFSFTSHTTTYTTLQQPPLRFNQLTHPNTTIKMALFGSSSSTPNNNPQEVKNTIKLQLQQEAAMANARSLIGVLLPPQSHSISPIPIESSLIINNDRKSTNTATTPASPAPAPPSPRKKKPACRNAWKSTSPRGTPSARLTSAVLRTRASVWVARRTPSL